jgi:sugar lactone lactonase YvrE
VNACYGLSVGDPCEEGDLPGTCVDLGWGELFCQPPNPCEGLRPGVDCALGERPGTCIDDGWGNLYCREHGPCHGRAVGAACVDPGGAAGLCADALGGDLYCQTPGPCEGLTARDECRDPWSGAVGRCSAGDGGALFCHAPNPCDGLALGAPCDAPWSDAPASCVLGPDALFCQTIPPCGGAAPGDACTTEWGAPGVCVDDGGGRLWCQELTGLCDRQAAGDDCRFPDGTAGVCVDDGTGVLLCVVPPCADGVTGAACQDALGRPGACEDGGDGTLVCRLVSPCAHLRAGDPCVSARAAAPGVCRPRAGRRLVCEPTPPCEGRRLGDECVPRAGAVGHCARRGTGGGLWCEAEPAGGAITAVATDACGNVYVADGGSGAVWRVSPDGAEIVPVASTFGAHVTALVWSTRPGDEGTLYAAVSGGADLLALSVGVPGRPAVLPAVPAVTPDTPPDQPAYDCLHLPNAPLETTELEGARGFHDVAFDAEGWLIGSDGSLLVGATRDGRVRPYAPLSEMVEGMDWLPDGSLVVASTAQGLVRILPTGAQEVLNPDIYAYGVTVGPDGRVYAADGSKVWRLDPAAGETRVWLDPQRLAAPWPPRTIAFDLDYSLMYVGSHAEAIYVVPIDEHVDPVGPPRRLGVVRPGVSWLDGLTVDACGNLYVPNYETSAIYRLGPDGVVSLYLEQTLEQYGHGLEWGSGLGGWRTDALYLPQPYDTNTVMELVVGIPGARPSVQPAR